MGQTPQDQADQRVDELRAELEKFVYVVTHDLRAPLRAVTHLSEWIEKDLGDNAPEDVTKNMALLRSRILRMDNLFQGLLRWSRAGRDGFTMDSVNTREALDRALRETMADRAFDVTVEGDWPTMETDGNALIMVMSEIFDNAIEFAKDGQLHVDGQRNNDTLTVSIRDYGPGVAEGHLPEIFHVFRTLSRRDDEERCGVGLTLVRKLIGLAGGKVWAECREPGLCIIFTWKASTGVRLGNS